MFSDPAEAGQAPAKPANGRKKRGKKVTPKTPTIRRGKNKRQPRAAVPAQPTPAPVAGGQAKRKARQPRAAKFDLAALSAFAGLKEADAKIALQVVQGLSSVNKKSRLKIVAAIGKVFA
jgi:hypothetical protein